MRIDIHLQSATLTQRLQHVHNVCIRFICNIRRSDHVKPSLEQLAWLRLTERRTFHSLSLLYNILHTSSPKYLSNRFSRLSDFHNLDSLFLQYVVLSIPLHHTTSCSSFITVSFARTWNSFPLSIRDCPTLSQLKNNLKRYLNPSQ